MMLINYQKQNLNSEPPHSIIRSIRSAILRTILFALIWWVLTDAAVDSWWVGVPVVIFATGISILLLPSFSYSVIGIVRFVPFFLWQSLRGGIDVAKRALHPKLPISPIVIAHRWQLPSKLSRIFMANTVSLLPGTLSTELDEKHLYVHVLDQHSAFTEELNIVEQRVADIFAIKLPIINEGGTKE